MEKAKLTYQTPEMEVLEVCAEKGIAQSFQVFGDPGKAGSDIFEENIYDL